MPALLMFIVLTYLCLFNAPAIQRHSRGPSWACPGVTDVLTAP